MCGKEFEQENPFEFLFEEPLKSIHPLCLDCISKKFNEAQPKEKIVVDESSLINEITLDCECLEDMARKQNAIINNKIVLDDIFIYELINANGEKRWAIETGGQYASDAYYSHIKLYSSPVTVVNVSK
jgi:glutaredoxin 2